MFRHHPKGLFILFFVSLFDRLAYYILFTILVLSLRAGYGLSEEWLGIIYAVYLFGVYFLGIGGGYVADRWLGYLKSGIIGLVLMLGGYVFLSVPLHSLPLFCAGLLVLIIGNGFYRSNLVALLGNLYDSPGFSDQRDNGFSIYYMGINVGALFAPFAAVFASDYYLAKEHFVFDAKLLEMANKYTSGMKVDLPALRELISHQPVHSADISGFCSQYLHAVSMGYHAAYIIAAIALLISLGIFLWFRTYLSSFDVRKDVQHETHHLSGNESERVLALSIVMFVVMFFWMSFYQNGFTLTLFANDYTQQTAKPATYLFFDLPSILCMMGAAVSVYIMVHKKNLQARIWSGLILLLCAAGVILRYKGFQLSMPIKAEYFQLFNPMFCIMLTPVILGLFTFLRKKKSEPSTPKKIGIGMLLTAITFVLMIFASTGLPGPKVLGGGISPVLISPWWLINVYLLTTIAELFLSPIGMSFVSKLSPSHLRGLMQGLWFGAMALGNLLSGLIGAFLWKKLELWQFFAVFVAASLLSAIFIFSVMRKLEKVSH